MYDSTSQPIEPITGSAVSELSKASDHRLFSYITFEYGKFQRYTAVYLPYADTIAAFPPEAINHRLTREFWGEQFFMVH